MCDSVITESRHHYAVNETIVMALKEVKDIFVPLVEDILKLKQFSGVDVKLINFDGSCRD